MVKEKPAPEDEPEEADSKQAEEIADKEEGENKDSEKLEAQEKPSQPELMSLAIAPKVCVMYSM